MATGRNTAGLSLAALPGRTWPENVDVDPAAHLGGKTPSSAARRPSRPASLVSASPSSAARRPSRPASLVSAPRSRCLLSRRVSALPLCLLLIYPGLHSSVPYYQEFKKCLCFPLSAVLVLFLAVFLMTPLGAGKESACNAGDLGSIPGLGRSPGEGDRLPTPVFWPGEFRGLDRPGGRKESDMTERLSPPLPSLLGVTQGARLLWLRRDRCLSSEAA